MLGNYNLVLVVLSFAVAVLASYTALDLSMRVNPVSGHRRSLWLLVGAGAMGLGIWSMHFIAILALQSSIEVTYGLGMAILSLISAVAASGGALWILSGTNLGRWSQAGGGCLMGSAITSMHYLGMASMRMPAEVTYDVRLVGLSIAIAISAAFIASGIIQHNQTAASPQLWQKVSAALLMGGAISGAHYTGIASMAVVPHLEQVIQDRFSISPQILAILVGLQALIILGLTLLSIRFEQHLMAVLAREEALQASDYQFRSLIQGMPVGVLLLDANGYILVKNEAADELLGLKSEATSSQALGSTGQFLNEMGSPISPEDLPIQHAISDHVISQAIVGYVASPEANPTWLLMNAIPNISEKKTLTQVICTISDLTPQKQAEAQLQASQERFALAVKAVEDGIWDLNLQSGEAYYSPRWTELMGFDRLESQDSMHNLQASLHPDDHIRVMATHEAYLKGALPKYAIEFRVRDHEHGWRWLLARGAAQPDCQGNPYRLIGSLTDITSRKMVETTLRQQIKLSELRADIGLALTEQANLKEMLEQCSVALHRHLDAALARIWTLNVTNQVLELQASAGTYTNLDDSQSCIMVGTHTIGRIVQLRQPYLTNQLQEDLHIATPDKSNQQGIVAFAGYPLMIQNRVLGVMAIFANHPLPNTVLKEMELVSQGIALGIDRKQAEEALRDSLEREEALANIIRQMRQTLDLETIFKSTTEELQSALNCDRTVIYRFNSDWSGEFVAEAVAEGWELLLVEQLRDSSLKQISTDNPNCAVKTMQVPETVIEDSYLKETQGGPYSKGFPYRCVNDIYQANFSQCYIDLLESFKARAYIIVPIFYGDRLWGLLASFQNSGSRRWKDAEIQMMRQISSHLGVAVQQAELLLQTQTQADELTLAKEAADTANHAKSEFLAHMSHELRTPLNAILGFTQVLQRDDTLSNEQRQSIDIIEKSGEHLLSLINNILEMSKIEAGKTVVNNQDVDLPSLLASLEDMLHLKADTKGLKLSIHYASNIPKYISIDESKLRQVLINLLGNAIKFTDTGHVSLTVQTTTDIYAQAPPSNNQIAPPETLIPLTFEVQDTGPGIAKSELDRLFKAFSQTHLGIKANEGTGLGLAISQKFVQLLGGQLAIKSEVGQGSVFYFTIPVMPTQTAVKPAILPSDHQIVGLAPNQPNYRILIADDDPICRLLMKKILSAVGFDINEVENGQEAIQAWETWRPHLIWMDIRMPVMTGYEAIRCIKGTPQGADTVVIALTASAFEEQRQHILASGCDDFLRKPFKRGELLDKISHHLNVKYAYADPSENAQAQVSTPLNSTPLNPPQIAATLSTLPPSWLKKLHYAAAQGSDEMIIGLVKQLPNDYSTLATLLHQMVNDFRFDHVLALVEEVYPKN